jgi:hypothetical protein
VAIKVQSFVGEKVYPHAHSWYSGEDKTLQIYQKVGDESEFTIAEFSDGSWEHVEFDPIPVPPNSDVVVEGEVVPESEDEEELSVGLPSVEEEKEGSK